MNKQIIDLSNIPLIDNHCHPFPAEREPERFERGLCIGLNPIDPDDMKHTVLYHMMISQLRRFFKLPETTSDEEVIERRNRACREDRVSYINSLVRDAGLEAILVDFGYPISQKQHPERFLKQKELDDFHNEVGVTTVYNINRIEWIANRLVEEEISFSEFSRRLVEETKAMIRDQNLIALKSVIAYLTGLEIHVLPLDKVRKGYYAYLADRNDFAAEKIVRDYTFIVACEICADCNIPLQVHTGLGDSPDCNLLKVNPCLMQEVFNDPRCQKAKIVLIHASYPYLEELGVLLNHYTNLYADLSSMVPYASFAADDKLAKIFEMAPLNKLFYGTDGAGIPEHMWLGAHIFRRSLANVLENLVVKGYISREYAMVAANNIMHENVKRVYNLNRMRKIEVPARKDHEAIRNTVGYYDFTHKLLEVTGKDACSFLDKLFVAPISKAKIGEAKYTTMLNEKGIIIDDVIVFHIDDCMYWVSTLYIDELIAWFNKHKTNENVSFREITPETTMYAVQGPNSKAVLNEFLSDNIDSLKYFHIQNNSIGSIPVKIARSGYTGELGYEIYCKPQDSSTVEEKLEKFGEPYGIKKISTDVIVTSLPREKGFVLMSDLVGTNPLEVGFDWTIDWNKNFIGKDSLLKVKEKGADRTLLGFTVDDDMAEIEPGTAVTVNGENVGKVTMFTYSFTIEKNIGFALIDNHKVSIGDTVTIAGKQDEVSALLTERIFYDPKNERIKGHSSIK